jgi:hypothetical protein
MIPRFKSGDLIRVPDSKINEIKNRFEKSMGLCTAKMDGKPTTEAGPGLWYKFPVERTLFILDYIYEPDLMLSIYLVLVDNVRVRMNRSFAEENYEKVDRK